MKNDQKNVCNHSEVNISSRELDNAKESTSKDNVTQRIQEQGGDVDFSQWTLHEQLQHLYRKVQLLLQDLNQLVLPLDLNDPPKWKQFLENSEAMAQKAQEWLLNPQEQIRLEVGAEEAFLKTLITVISSRPEALSVVFHRFMNEDPLEQFQGQHIVRVTCAEAQEKQDWFLDCYFIREHNQRIFKGVRVMGHKQYVEDGSPIMTWFNGSGLDLESFAVDKIPFTFREFKIEENSVSIYEQHQPETKKKESAMGMTLRTLEGIGQTEISVMGPLKRHRNENQELQCHRWILNKNVVQQHFNWFNPTTLVQLSKESAIQKLKEEVFWVLRFTQSFKTVNGFEGFTIGEAKQWCRIPDPVWNGSRVLFDAAGQGCISWLSNQLDPEQWQEAVDAKKEKEFLKKEIKDERGEVNALPKRRL